MYYVQEQLIKSHFPTTTYKYIPEVNDFKGGYEPEGSGSLLKTPDGKEYSVQELVDKIAKESDNVGHNIWIIMSPSIRSRLPKTLDKLAKKHWCWKEKHPLKWLAMSWRPSINKWALLLMRSSQNMMINGLRDLPVKLLMKSEMLYDFRHDATRYTNSPYVIAIYRSFELWYDFQHFKRYLWGIEIMKAIFEFCENKIYLLPIAVFWRSCDWTNESVWTLYKNKERLKIHLVLAHVNHGQRPESILESELRTLADRRETMYSCGSLEAGARKRTKTRCA